MTRVELLPVIFKLSRQDQLMIAEAIRNHLVGKLAPADEAEFRAELARRVADADANPGEESPLAETLGRLRSKR